MSIDYGEIETYDTDRGFGFVSRRLGDFAKNHVFFHIKKIKNKYPDLANKLDDYAYFGVSFWYSIETTEKGEQVSEVWLNVDELSHKTRGELIHAVGNLWKDLSRPLPSMVERNHNCTL